MHTGIGLGDFVISVGIESRPVHLGQHVVGITYLDRYRFHSRGFVMVNHALGATARS